MQSIEKGNEFKILDKDKQRIDIEVRIAKGESFDKWKNEVPLYKSNSSMHLPTKALAKGEINSILKKILNYQVLNKTPIECMQFIVEIQENIKNQKPVVSEAPTPNLRCGGETEPVEPKMIQSNGNQKV